MDRTALRSLLRSYIHNTDTASNDNFSDAALNSFLYEAVGLVQSEAEDQDVHLFDAESTTSMSATDTTITLPSDFRQLIDLRRVDTGYNTQFQIVDRREIFKTTRDPIESLSKYRAYINATQIVYPVALGEAHQVKLVYSASLPNLTLDAQSWALPRQAEQAVVLKAAILANKSDGMASNQWESEYAEALRQVIRLRSRVNNAPRYVRMPYA